MELGNCTGEKQTWEQARNEFAGLPDALLILPLQCSGLLLDRTGIFQTRSMRLLIHGHAGHPFQMQLSREPARRGHTVLHAFAGELQTPRGGG